MSDRTMPLHVIRLNGIGDSSGVEGKVPAIVMSFHGLVWSAEEAAKIPLENMATFQMEVSLPSTGTVVRQFGHFHVIDLKNFSMETSGLSYKVFSAATIEDTTDSCIVKVDPVENSGERYFVSGHVFWPPSLEHWTSKEWIDRASTMRREGGVDDPFEFRYCFVASAVEVKSFSDQIKEFLEIWG